MGSFGIDSIGKFMDSSNENQRMDLVWESQSMGEYK